MIADFTEAVRTMLGVSADIWKTGAYFTATNDAPPRYVWVPTTDTIEGAGNSGAFGARTPRALLTRYAGLDCHVWGTNLATTEAMVHALLSAVHQTIGADAQYGAVRWTPEGLNDNGILAVVSIAIPIPITAAAIESVVTGTFDTIECDDEPTVPADGFIECCEEIDP